MPDLREFKKQGRSPYLGLLNMSRPPSLYILTTLNTCAVLVLIFYR